MWRSKGHIRHSPVNTSVNIFLPKSSIMGTRFGIQERVYATIQVTTPAGVEVPGDRNDGHIRSILGAQPRSIATTIRYCDRRHYLVVMQMIALASCSILALTAAQQTVSVVGVGVGVRRRISLNKLG